MASRRTRRPQTKRLSGFEQLESRRLLTGEIFFDDFNRPDGEVANGWSSFIHGNGVPFAIASGVATDPNTNLGVNASSAAGIHRSFPIGDVTLVSGILYESMAASGFGNKFEVGAFVGSNGGQLSGLGVIVVRSGEWYNDSSVYLYFNGVLLNTIRSTFQFRSELQFDFSLSRAGDISGRISEGTNEFLFQSSHDITSFEGNEVMLWSSPRDDRGHPGPLPRIDDVRIESKDFDFDLEVVYDSQVIPNGGGIDLGEIVAWEDQRPKFISIKNRGQYTYRTAWIEFPDSFASHYSIEPSIKPNHQINLALMPTGPGSSVGNLKFTSIDGTSVRSLTLNATSDTDRTQVVIYFDEFLLHEEVLLSKGWRGEGDVNIPAFATLFNSQGESQFAIETILSNVREHFSPYNVDIRRGGPDHLSLFLGRNNLQSRDDEDTVVYVTSAEETLLGFDDNLWGIAQGAESEVFGSLNNFDDIAFVFAGEFSTQNSFERLVSTVVSHEVGHTFGLAHAKPDLLGGLYSETRRHELMTSSGIGLLSDPYRAAFLDLEIERTEGRSPVSSHRHLFGFDSDLDGEVIAAERGVLGPSTKPWVASLVPGQLTVFGDVSANSLEITHESGNRWSLKLDGHSYVFDEAHPDLRSKYLFDAPLNLINISLLSGNDQLSIAAEFQVSTIVVGGDGDDVIFGGGAADQLLGGSGNDWIFGQDGNDSVRGGSGNDFLYGDGGDDLIKGDSDEDYLYGNLGNDRLDGGVGTDWLFGDEGSDVLFGGQDELVDNLLGGGGADMFVLLNFDLALDFQVTLDRKDRGRGQR